MIDNVNQIEAIHRLWQQRESGGLQNAIDSPQDNPLPGDKVTLSQNSQGKNQNGSQDADSKENFTPEKQQQISDLKKRDAEVKAHERAHMAAGGGLVQGGASYQYQRGPDGRSYAVGGEVRIDVSPERTPEATIQKMEQVKAAALAPAQPSATDRAVAAQAAQIEAQARTQKSSKSQSSETPAEIGSSAAGANTPPHAQVQSGAGLVAAGRESMDTGPFTYEASPFEDRINIRSSPWVRGSHINIQT